MSNSMMLIAEENFFSTVAFNFIKLVEIEKKTKNQNKALHELEILLKMDRKTFNEAVAIINKYDPFERNKE